MRANGSYLSKLKDEEKIDIEGKEAYYVINGDLKKIQVIDKLEKPVNDLNNSDLVF